VADLIVTRHALMRFRERVRPALSLGRANRELEALLAVGKVGRKPEWTGLTRPDGDYVLVGEDVAFPIADGHLTTCLTRVGMSKPRPKPERRVRRVHAPKRRAADFRQLEAA
jgi:hypothetical protein